MGISKRREKHQLERVGMTKENKEGDLMKIIEYISAHNVIVEFQDKYKGIKKCTWDTFKNGLVRNPNRNKEKEGLEKENTRGCIMRIVKYNNCTNIVVEFQDSYKHQTSTSWKDFIKGNVKNPYYPQVLNVGMIGVKYPAKINKKHTKEYCAWYNILIRCYDKKFKEKYPAYKDVTVCEEWLLYENFYEWIHSQENFEKWLDEDRWAVDKDILVKGNKLYSPETCCLVPQNVNTLFIKCDASRGNLPVGVCKNKNDNRYVAKIIYGNNKNNNRAKATALLYPTPEDAFYLGYKPYKEAYIKQIAQEEYNNGNITKKCYNAMMAYEVEITD